VDGERGHHFPAGDILDHHQYLPGRPADRLDWAYWASSVLGLPVKGHLAG
jgi:hypothetical protein